MEQGDMGTNSATFLRDNTPFHSFQRTPNAHVPFVHKNQPF